MSFEILQRNSERRTAGQTQEQAARLRANGGVDSIAEELLAHQRD